MLKYIPVVAVLLLAAPAEAGVTDILDRADEKASEFLEGKTPVEDALKAFGDLWKGLCASIGGEWVAEGPGDLAPGECKR